MNRKKYEVFIENKGKDGNGSWFESFLVDAISKDVAVKLAKIDFKENEWNRTRRMAVVSVSEI